MFSFRANIKEALLLKHAALQEKSLKVPGSFSFLQFREKLHEYKVQGKGLIQMAVPWGSHFFFFFLFFLGLHPWHMEIPRLGVESEV